jgi:tetratricopeptide (TPR) repeat protein
MQAEAKRQLIESKANVNEAVTLSERALALDPRNMRALNVLARSLVNLVEDGYSDDPASDTARAEKTIDTALALQPDSSWAHAEKGHLYSMKKQWRPAIAEVETAIGLDRNDAVAHARAGFYKMMVGRSEDGIASVETALRLSPHDALTPWWQYNICHLHSHLAHWEQAIEWCEKSTAWRASGAFGFFYPFIDLVADNAWLGRDKEAKEAGAQLQKLYPGFTVQTFLSFHFTDDPTFNAQYQRLAEGLRKAGVPEGEKKTN